MTHQEWKQQKNANQTCCDNCKFFVESPFIVDDQYYDDFKFDGHCIRYPKYEPKLKDQYCGEFQRFIREEEVEKG